MANENYILLERTELNATAVEEKLFDLARNGNRDAYVILGYVLERIETLNGCWVLKGNNSGYGYTTISVNGRRKGAHKLLLETLQGSIVPKGLVVDHMCHNEAAEKMLCSGGPECKHRACFNPNHMEVTTHQINVSRGSKSFWNKPACPSGHPRSQENMFTDTYGRPVCKPCHRYQSMLAKRIWRKRKKDLANG